MKTRFERLRMPCRMFSEPFLVLKSYVSPTQTHARYNHHGLKFCVLRWRNCRAFKALHLKSMAQALIGHDSEEIHKMYAEIGFESLKKATATLPEI